MQTLERKRLKEFYCPKCGLKQSVHYGESDIINVLVVMPSIKVECAKAACCFTFLLPLKSIPTIKMR
jgi:hypothetical protein